MTFGKVNEDKRDNIWYAVSVSEQCCGNVKRASTLAVVFAGGGVTKRVEKEQSGNDELEERNERS